MSSNKQPVIGITLALDNTGRVLPGTGAEYSFIRKEYGEQIRAAGGQPIYLDNSIDPMTAAEMCDGIVISGGEDINPAVYDQKQLVPHILEPIERTEWERRLIEACDKRGVRILGICYGSQLLNLYYGGSIYQDIATELGTEKSHGTTMETMMQRVKFTEDFLRYQKDDYVETAHRHHQAVRDLAPGFKAIAQTEDGVIEAIAGHGHFGVQWHSEFDGTAQDIYGAFVDICASQDAKHGTLSSNPLPEAL